MSKLRSINTAIWSDVWFETLSPKDKLLFMYLITNEKTNMLGIYESSLRKISFETGISENDIKDGLKRFESVSKVKYVDNHVILINFMKHQNYNTNMKKSAIDIYNSLPKVLKNTELDVSKDNPLKGFETLLNHFGMVRKIEVEVESELEVEKEDKFPFSDFWNTYDKKTDTAKCKSKWKRLSDKDKSKIMEVVESYIKSTPDKQYRKNPLTWLNGKCWLDDIKAIAKEKEYDEEGREIVGYAKDGRRILKTALR